MDDKNIKFTELIKDVQKKTKNKRTSMIDDDDLKPIDNVINKENKKKVKFIYPKN